MTYDPPDPDPEYHSVSMEGATITNIPAGETVQHIDYDSDSGAQAGEFVQYTDAVGTASAPILDLTAPGVDTWADYESGAFVVVTGQDTADSLNTFVDLILFATGGPANTIGQITNGTAAARTYSVTGNPARTLEVAMGASTYDIGATATAIRHE